MLINLFTKVFLTSSNTHITNKGGQFNPIILSEKDLDNDGPVKTIHKIMKNIDNKYLKYSFNIIVPENTEACYKLVAWYLWYIGIYDIVKAKELTTIYTEHYKILKDQWSNILTPDDKNDLYCLVNGSIMDLIFYMDKCEDKFTDPGIRIDSLPYIPSEYLFNCIDDEYIGDIVRDKMEAFRAYDILNALTTLMYKKSLEEENTADIFRSVQNFYALNPLATFKEIAVTDSGKDSLKSIFEKYGEQDIITNLIDTDTLSYFKYAIDNTNMGYSDLGLFKFNKLLAKYVIDSGFKPEIYREVA